MVGPEGLEPSTCRIGILGLVRSVDGVGREPEILATDSFDSKELICRFHLMSYSVTNSL